MPAFLGRYWLASFFLGSPTCPIFANGVLVLRSGVIRGTGAIKRSAPGTTHAAGRRSDHAVPHFGIPRCFAACP